MTLEGFSLFLENILKTSKYFMDDPSHFHFYTQTKLILKQKIEQKINLYLLN